MRNKAKRLIVWLLTFTMIFSCFPLMAFADGGDDSAIGGHIRLSDLIPYTEMQQIAQQNKEVISIELPQYKGGNYTYLVN